jgi:hypothetical protein
MHTSTGSPAPTHAGPLPTNLLPIVAALLLAFFFGSVLFGAVIYFSPVPVEDSWRGMVGFYLDSENPGAWWAQHNDHRIIIAKLLFWLDMRFVDGSGLLLIPLNIVLLASTGWLLFAYANRLIAFPSGRERLLVGASLGMLCLAWMQNKNIISSFQNEFILAFLLPLLSFYCFARALQAQSATRWFILSLVTGLASAHCLINGLLALPILALLSWFTERSPRRFFLILLCAAASIAIFLIGYQSSMASPIGIVKLRDDPLSLLIYALAYLGGPWQAVFGRIEGAIGFGALAIGLTTYLFITRKAYGAKPFALALVAYAVYVFAAAGMTAFGRSMFPLALATTSRYLTPTLFMWAALLILLLARSRHVARWSAVAVLVIASLLLPTQMDAFRIESSDATATPHGKAVAALSLQLGIHDLGAKRRLLLFYRENLEPIFQRAREQKVSIFAERYAFPADQVGRRLQDVGGEPCSGQITASLLVDEGRVAYAIAGVLAQDSARDVRYLLLGDGTGIVKGVAIVGRDIPGPDGLFGPLYFDGYIFAAPDFTELRCIR